MKAKHLNEGDRLRMKGEPWSVVSAVLISGGQVRLTVAHTSGRTFTKAVDKGTEFDLIDRVRPVDDPGPEPQVDGVANVMRELGAVELWRKFADGRYVVQHVDEATIAAHLMIFHGVTWNGVSNEEARLVGSERKGLSKEGKATSATYDDPMAERTMKPEEALKHADFQGMMLLHDSLHASAANMPTQHTHADLRPKVEE